MRLTARFLILSIALAAVPIAFILPTGCSGQGEGERCNHLGDNAGSDDCAGDLVCVASGRNAKIDTCCPADPAQATTFACQLPAAGGIDAAPPPPASDAATDAPTTDAPTSDAPATDAPATTDAPADSPADAPADAPEDGG
jgi:hypothetical protein